MSGLSFIGSYSGIDQATIDKLMQVERQPLKLYNSRKTSITEQQNAWKDINTRLNSLFGKIEVLKSANTFMSMKATSTNEGSIGVSASDKAVAGKYMISVEQLATSTSIIGNEAKGPLKEGSFTIGGTKEDLERAFKEENDITEITGDNAAKFEEYQKARTITVAGGASLNDVAKEINAKSKDTGVSASVINGKMVLNNENTGDGEILLSDSVDKAGTLSGLGLKEITASNYQTIDGIKSFVDTDIDPNTKITGSVGKNAIFDINGVSVERTSNSVTDVIEGLTINLKEKSTSFVTVGLDNDKAEKAIQDFVDQYNSTMKFIEEKLAAGDPEVEGSAGTLSGDGTLMRLHSTLKNFVTSIIFDKTVDSKEYDGFNDASQLGITTKDRYGELQFDATKFRAALLDNPDKVKNFFFGVEQDEDGNDVETGFVAKVNGYIDSFISTKNGIIKNKNESYDKTLKDISKQIEAFEARMVIKEKVLIKKFTALDVAMMKAESQMEWLSGQINAMNGMKK